MDGQYIASDGKLKMRALTLEDSQLIVDWRNNPRVRSRYIYREPFTLEGQEEPYLKRYEQDTEYTFDKAGSHRVVLYAVFTQNGDTVAVNPQMVVQLLRRFTVNLKAFLGGVGHGGADSIHIPH